MAFAYLSVERLEDAREKFIAALERNGFAAPGEDAPAAGGLGRITASAVYARINAPHYPACAMDGIAVSARDTFGATETTPVTLAPCGFDWVDTGDPLPPGRDAVIMVEDVVREGDSAVLYSPAAPWQHVRQIGEDICAGDMIMTSRTRVTPAAIGAMLAAGVGSFRAARRPIIGIIPTGDELTPPSASPAPGEIMEFNSAIFSAMLTEWGAEPRVYPIVRDRLADIKEALSAALGECDMVLLNAGSSAGRDDLSAEAIASVATVLTHGVAIRPGKPVILAAAGPKAVIGVPGYPVSGVIALEEFARPAIDLWFGVATPPGAVAEASLSRPVVSGLKYREYVRARLGRVGGVLAATPLGGGAGVVSSLMKADGIITIPVEREGAEAGERVGVSLLRGASEIDNALIVTGSHDPLIDELADLLCLAERGLRMSSAHVGSMGGLMALRRREAHIAGIHLLDESDGSYNVSYVKKYIPDGGVCLIECVGRTQGIMTAAGNPLGIKCPADLARDGVRYVNRQKGSGTRILFDYLLRQDGIPAADIYGYEREELTHSSVAAQIASGTADAGMGILSAARLCGLDFVPVCTETYDLLISQDAMEKRETRLLLELLGSERFRERVERLGGYTLGEPGRIKARF